MAHSYASGDRVAVDPSFLSPITKSEYGISDTEDLRVDITDASKEPSYPGETSQPLYDGDCVDYTLTLEDFREAIITGTTS